MELNLRALTGSSRTNNQPSSNFFGSQTATLTRQKENIAAPKDDISIEIDDTIYELAEQPDLELGSGLIDTLGVEANDLLDADFITKEEENDAVLEQIKEDYNFDEIKDTFDEGVLFTKVSILLWW